MRVVSGGQTGVDRAALDAALVAGLPVGGWCPAGRKAEDGAIDARYPMQETPSDDYVQRTTWNVRDSDGTLVLLRGPAAGGTYTTLQAAASLGRPVMVIEVNVEPEQIESWIRSRAFRTLNVAGPRESEAPGIYEEAFALLVATFRRFATDSG